MRNNYGIFFFLLGLITHIAGIYTDSEMLEKITKPLLIPVLAGYFIWGTKSFQAGLKKWVLLALFFSWVGDILLMVVTEDPAFFLLGLVAFLLAHVFYIFFFHAIRIHEKISGRLFCFSLFLSITSA
jgi:uncharacterized membrane protein YhhN